MAGLFSILIVEQTAWSLVTPTGDQIKVAPNATAVSNEVKSHGSTKSPLVLAIPSAWCLSATISTQDLPKNDPKARLYRLEENLPLAAENIVADFVTADDSALGVCVRLELIQPLLDSLKAEGVTIQAILPTALAIAQALTKSITQETCLLLCHELEHNESKLNVIALQHARPIQWDLIPATTTDLKLQLELLSTQFGSIPHIEAIDLDAELADNLVESCTQVINIQQAVGSSLAASLSNEILTGRTKPWINFRRDQLAMGDALTLHRRWINTTLVAALAFFLSLTIAFLYRAHRYQQIDQANTTKMVEAFHDHFPNWEIPINVRAVVDAQYRQASGTNDTSNSTTSHNSALTTLHDVLLPMLTQDHFQVDHMSFHENAFEISGRLQSYEQIDALAKAARVNGMNVAPAQTRKDADGSWTFILQGSRPTKTAVTQ